MTDGWPNAVGGTRAPKAAVAPRGATLHERFASRVADTPHAVALSFEGEVVTYRDLDQRANQLAHYLRRMGVGRESIVGLLVERSLETVIGVLAVLKAGGAYLPFDLAYPPERLRFMLSDAKAPVVLTQAAHAEALAGAPAHVVPLDEAWPAIARESPLPPAVSSEPSDLAYVIYTSGSTGVPKGVMVEHRHVTRLFDAAAPHFHFDARDVWTLFHSVAFDFSVWEIWGALLHGGRLVVVPFLASRSARDFHALLQRERVTVLNQTPSAFRAFAHADAEAGGDLDLRYVIFGGEALDPRSLRGWIERHGDEAPELANMYGITETTVHVTYRRICRADLLSSTASPIGRPLADLQVHLLDPAGTAKVAEGELGELCVAGAGVSRGYLNRSELTAARFVADAGGGPGQMYRSGDLARRRGDGELEFVGRIDHQVKIRGFRVELGEIEARLSEHPKVRDAVVFTRDGDAADGSDKHLVAYVVPTEGASSTTQELRAALKAALPDYMIPAAVVFLRELPLTTNGKVDREALSRIEVSSPAAEPAVAVVEKLTAIWQKLLMVPTLAPGDDFFELGAHSMMLFNALHAIEVELGVRLQFRELFENPTIAELTKIVARYEASDGEYEHAFDLRVGDEVATFYLSKEEFERDGLPDGAMNPRVVKGSR